MSRLQAAVVIGGNLKAARRQAGLTQERLSFLAGIHHTQIGHLERGHRICRVDTLIKLASACQVPPGDLLAGVEWRPGSTTPGDFHVDP